MLLKILELVNFLLFFWIILIKFFNFCFIVFQSGLFLFHSLLLVLCHVNYHAFLQLLLFFLLLLSRYWCFFSLVILAVIFLCIVFFGPFLIFLQLLLFLLLFGAVCFYLPLQCDEYCSLTRSRHALQELSIGFQRNASLRLYFFRFQLLKIIVSPLIRFHCLQLLQTIRQKLID